MPPLALRPISRDDAPAFAELRIEALRNHPVAFTVDLGESMARTPQDWRDYVDRTTGNGASGVIFLAAAPDGQLAGMVGVHTPPQPKLKHAGLIWGVYVRAAHRNAGLGSRLLNAAKAWAREKGLVALRLSVTAGNDAALRCYHDAGFTPYGTEPQAVFYEGVYYDEILMACKL